MDIVQILANGGIVTVLGGILYKLQERRLKKLEVGSLDITTALLEQAVLNLTKELATYNGKKKGE